MQGNAAKELRTTDSDVFLPACQLERKSFSDFTHVSLNQDPTPQIRSCDYKFIMISLHTFRVVQMTHSPWDNILGAPEESPSGPSSLSRFRSRTATQLSPITDELQF
jgi:hypothetical protein